jgi:hypothetical protein
MSQSVLAVGRVVTGGSEELVAPLGEPVGGDKRLDYAPRLIGVLGASQPAEVAQFDGRRASTRLLSRW